MWAAVLWADSFGVEVRGVERVPEDERHHARPSDAGALWASANMTISTFSLGTLGNSIWYLELTDACLTILFFNLLCTIPVAIFSTWGKSTGLRQMIVGRYSFGTIGIYIPIILNCIACIGWSVVNTIVGGQALAAVSDTHNLPVVAGIVIIAGVTLFVALFGYKIVHTFERYASIPVVIIFVIMLGQAAPHVTAAMGPPGAATAASVLSFGATIAGFAFGWTSLASDYTVNLPAETSNTKVFAWTYMGLNLPLIFVECLGAIMMATFKQKSTWEDAYNSHHLGGLLGAPLVGPMGGFGRFLLVILGLSIIANNIPNMYSFALTFQAFGKAAQSIPRMFLVIIGTVIYIGLAIGGRNSFESVLDTLLVILAYWLIIYSVVLLEEHYIFRKGSFARGYDLDAYNTPSKLPIGLAAIGAICFGIAGAVVGMSQTWYVGPIGKMIGPPPFGGDIGFELSGGFAAVVYPAFRYLELKYVGR
ncbi:BQ5605_C007g04480 [Microbotryum silenes-dioicae]|uniref:BQ5605_C007g04480 protein n=1 Tax=Microbotryum silenes-dioicae TaxID=796604 RepID=A0A2X0M786_9BASI|nr:BQ5605_C007g04480 [Microbotryum silenes-dioicae]